MIACRRKHGENLKLRQDYYQRTIENARKEAARDESAGGGVRVRKQPEDVGLTKMLADRICETEHFACDKGRLLYVYSNGVYVPRGQQVVRRLVKELLNEENLTKKWSSHRAKEVIDYISDDAPELWESPPQDRINVLNGIVRLDLTSGNHTPQDHTPDHLCPVQLPVAYDAEARCEFWETFIAQTFPADAQEVAFEIPAWLMTPDVSRHKAILLFGEGANGKSTFLSAVTSFIGHQNTTSTSLQKLESNRFAAAQLVGKLANVCADLPSTSLQNTSFFKAVVGGDRITVERKNQHPFDVKLYARLVFSANHLPRAADSSHAFFRRWEVLPFLRTFEAHEQIPRRELDARLSSPKELSGVLNRALAIQPRLLREGFRQSTSMLEANDEFRRTTDPLSVWLERSTFEQIDHLVPCDLLRKEYQAACLLEGRPIMTDTAFGMAFKRLKPHIEKKQRTYANELKWCYINIGLRDL
jgi:P4 family phage/plasmid primase-like protien